MKIETWIETAVKAAISSNIAASPSQIYFYSTLADLGFDNANSVENLRITINHNLQQQNMIENTPIEGSNPMIEKFEITPNNTVNDTIAIVRGKLFE